MIKIQFADISLLLDTENPNESVTPKWEGTNQAIAIAKKRLTVAYGMYGHIIKWDLVNPYDAIAAINQSLVRPVIRLSKAKNLWYPTPLLTINLVFVARIYVQPLV